MASSTLEPLLDAAQTAEFLNFGLNTVRIKTRAGEIPSIRIGRSVRYRRVDLERWVDSKAQRGAA